MNLAFRVWFHLVIWQFQIQNKVWWHIFFLTIFEMCFQLRIMAGDPTRLCKMKKISNWGKGQNKSFILNYAIMDVYGLTLKFDFEPIWFTSAYYHMEKSLKVTNTQCMMMCVMPMTIATLWSCRLISAKLLGCLREAKAWTMECV